MNTSSNFPTKKTFTGFQEKQFAAGCNGNSSELSVSMKDITDLRERATGIKRADTNVVTSLGRKMCPTRHGCQGATNCDYSYGNYPG